ncbi:MAG TPA: ATP-binding protein [Methanoregulaceae archaeon]|nr:ATP-binding protein [Methanoregulaceae archaeon]
METRFDLAIGSEVAMVRTVTQRLEEAMQLHGFSSEETLDTQLAVEEAITNVIVHGYGRPGETILVSSRIRNDRAEVCITDTAPRFDPLSVADPDTGEGIDDREIGGLGVFLIRRVMDEVSYRYEEGKNILVLAKLKRSSSLVHS